MEVTIFGASDDLVEVEGDFYDEFTPKDDDGMWLVFGDGSIVGIRYDEGGVWRIWQIKKGSATFEKVEAPADDESNYSDRVTLTGELSWMLVAETPRLIESRTGAARA